MADLFRSGEILTAAKLNAAFGNPRHLTVAGDGSISHDADGDTVRVDGYSNIYVRLTGKDTANTPIKYAWKEVYRNANGTWSNTTHNGTTIGDYAVEINNSHLNVHTQTVYRAERSPESGEWLLSRGGGGGDFDIKGKDIVLMILGTEEEYANCTGAPDPSPGCWQGYAWAAYKVCGYEYTKLFDARDLGKWALELNGGTTSAWRRFHPAFWGWDSYTEGLPTAANACEGVRFIGAGASALSCTCPTWASNITCLKFSANFKTLEEVPCNNGTGECECNGTFYTDMAPYWGTTANGTLCQDVGNGCIWQGEVGPFSFNFVFEEIPRGDDECVWGPETFDPCEPCDGFTRFSLSVNKGSSSGGGPGQEYSVYSIPSATLRTLSETCNGTQNMTFVNHFTGSVCADVINWIKVECCSANETANCA
jgi:hypothetical protein